MPQASLLTVLNVAGATTMAVAGGSTSGVAWLLVLDADRVAGEFGQVCRVEEPCAVRGGDDGGVPALLLSEADEVGDLGGGRTAAGDDVRTGITRLP